MRNISLYYVIRGTITVTLTLYIKLIETHDYILRIQIFSLIFIVGKLCTYSCKVLKQIKATTLMQGWPTLRSYLPIPHELFRIDLQ